ncbi:MAG: PepSY domain-containing protein [Deltaproteobacteria bacterium]|nr:PepSY domain-containing protein [Deltaproteobacteria bacterium]
MKSRDLAFCLLALVFALATSCSGSGASSKRAALLADVDFGSLVGLAEAIAIAQEEVPGGIPVEAGLEIEDDDENEPAAYEVALFDPGTNELIEVEVDAATGDVLEVEVEDDADEEGEDDDSEDDD